MFEEFLHEYGKLLDKGIILLAVLTGILCYPKFKKTIVRFFIYFLIYVVFVDLLGYYPSAALKYERLNWILGITEGTILERNYLWYTVFWNLGTALFLSFYFYQVLENSKFKSVIKYTCLLFLVGSLSYAAMNYKVYYQDDIKLIRIWGVIQIMLCAVLYFTEILMSDKIINFYKSFHFYVASAFFIWFLIRTPISFYQIYYNSEDQAFSRLRANLFLLNNLFLYLTITIAFIKCKPQELTGEV